MKSWDRHFLDLCAVVAERSKDPSTRIGAVVADANCAVVSTGYNGPPRTCDDTVVPWTRPEKYPWIVHAETNAVLFAVAAKGAYTLTGCTLYTSGTLCSRCALLVAHVGIRRVVCGPTRPVCCDDEDRRLAATIAAACGMVVEW